MSPADRVWIGADPGGTGRFGCAILDSEGSVSTWCVSCADEAVEIIKREVQSPLTLAGVGVDAPLWWSSGRSSERRADHWLRDGYNLKGYEVQAGNSLSGACLIQGVMFVTRMREEFPGVPVTETHPKALMKALRLRTTSWAKHFEIKVKIKNEDERDAAISAASAREGFEGRWTIDLSVDRHPSEQNPSSYWLAPVHYFWPET